MFNEVPCTLLIKIVSSKKVLLPGQKEIFGFFIIFDDSELVFNDNFSVRFTGTNVIWRTIKGYFLNVNTLTIYSRHFPQLLWYIPYT